jgi:4-phytase/acid phosphatase
MNLFKRMVILFGLVLTLSVPVPVWVLAQTFTNDGTTLKQIIIFGRHSIRSSTVNPTTLAQYAVDPYPPFEVQPGCLTPNGTLAEGLLGAYYRDYLIYEGLLTGNAGTDAAHSYFRSNSIERSWATATAFQGALIPNSTPSVHSFPIGGPDPVFDPILANVAKVDANLAATQVQEIFNSGAALESAYSGEYSLIRSVLFDYPLGTQPPPPTPQNCGDTTPPTSCSDPTSQAITLTASTTTLYTGGVINIGGLLSVNNAADPFVMQYADGFPLDQVAWGQLTLDQLSQQTRIINYEFNIEMLSPYLNSVQSSNAASHVLRTMQQAVNGVNVPGAFGNAKSRAVVVISSDAYVAGLAGVLHLHWQLPGYQPDYCAPGGALVFELRQSNSSKGYIVRAFYTAQTFDQLRNLTPLALDEPPATIQLLIPGGSTSATDLDVSFAVFQKLLSNAINPNYVEDPSKEGPPNVLTGVTCQ